MLIRLNTPLDPRVKSPRAFPRAISGAPRRSAARTRCASRPQAPVRGIRFHRAGRQPASLRQEGKLGPLQTPDIRQPTCASQGGTSARFAHIRDRAKFVSPTKQVYQALPQCKQGIRQARSVYHPAYRARARVVLPASTTPPRSRSESGSKNGPTSYRPNLHACRWVGTWIRHRRRQLKVREGLRLPRHHRAVLDFRLHRTANAGVLHRVLGRYNPWHHPTSPSQPTQRGTSEVLDSHEPGRSKS